MKRIVLAGLLVIVGYSLWSFWADENLQYDSVEKIRGVNFVSPRDDFDPTWMESIKSINGEWISLVPYAMARGRTPELIYDHERQWWGEKPKGTQRLISYARQCGYKIMIKPHVWVRGDGWPGDFDLATEEEWKIWEKNYREYILTYVEIAARNQVELFCIGTEFRQSVKQRPAFWRSLIDTCRSIYRGKLTYAANWDNYENVAFWDKLDYIGIDAYFPLCEDKTPTHSSLISGWQTRKKALKEYASSHKKRILFTEYGYQSSDYAAAGHWTIDSEAQAVNMQAQAISYEALYQTFWKEPWFAGGFLWKWFPNPATAGGLEDPRYTPQNKPAADVIRSWYSQ